MDIKKILSNHNISVDVAREQFFLADDKVLDRIVDLAQLSPDDVVLEVGAGVGNLTERLAEQVRKVISFEIDERFKPILEKLPPNVEMHYEDAWDFIQLHGKFRKRKEYNKIVANPPYTFIEKWLHNLTLLDYDKVILLVPLATVKTIKETPEFNSFFEAVVKIKVDKHSFIPVPKTNSAVISLVKLPDPIQTKNLPLFLRQYLYQREDKKVKNSLREGLIDFTKLALGKTLTKKQARDILAGLNLDNNLLEKRPTYEMYQQISEKFDKIAVCPIHKS